MSEEKEVQNILCERCGIEIGKRIKYKRVSKSSGKPYYTYDYKYNNLSKIKVYIKHENYCKECYSIVNEKTINNKSKEVKFCPFLGKEWMCDSQCALYVKIHNACCFYKGLSYIAEAISQIEVGGRE